MAISNTTNTPPLWDDAALQRQAQTALDDFVNRRLAEPSSRYSQHLRERRRALQALFRQLASFDPQNPDVEIARRVLTDPHLEAALRYVAGPPVSKDDLGVLATRGRERVGSAAIRTNPTLAGEMLALICRLADSERFPWVARGRAPKAHEIKRAVRATTALHAAQAMQTERRAYGKEVERLLRERLMVLGYEQMRKPNRGRITAPMHMPRAKSFYGECSVQGRRADLLIGLSDGRAVAVEAKDSSSVVNSVKRVLNDTAAKARHWRERFGETLVPVALLSGVFGIDSLKSAQASGLYLVWSHDLDSFTDWLAAQ